jgi:glycosyltransferase involved in cell wall biosynthesis
MDIIPFIHPEWWPLTGGSNRRFKDNLCAAIQRSDHIIAISESTRRDILEYFRVPESKVSTILLGPGLDFPKLDDCCSRKIVCSAYKIEPGYILCVGSQAPNKNLKSVVEAYGILNQQGVDLPQLVITGPSIGSQKELLAAIDRYQLESKIIFTGFVPVINLAALYRSAGVFVYPSLYEGFGLVVLEAMSCLCPVITSNTSSLPEVVGESAITVDPQNPYELADAIRRVLLEPGVAEHLRKKGEIQAKKFSWENCANETYRVYQKVLGS